MSLNADALVERRRLKRRLVAWRAGAIFALVGLALVLLYRYQPPGMLPGGDHVARVSVSGVIFENGQLEDALDAVAKNTRAKALIVYVNSPGGSTFGGEALYRALRRVGDKKPVVAVIGTLGASAGYMVATAGDRIYARDTSITGSIGVLFQSAEISGLMEKVGVTSQTITSGALKDEPSLFKPLSPVGRRVMQELVNETYQWFVDLIVERRRLPRDKVLAVADGRVLTGRAALAAGLIDELGGEREARAWLDDKHGIDKDLPVRDVRAADELWRWREAVGEIFGKMMFPERLTLDGLISLWHVN
jgi:protease-4